MDISDFIVGLGVLLVIIASEVSGRKNKKAAHKTPPPRRAPVNAHVRQHTPTPVQPGRKPQQQNQLRKQTAAKTEHKPFLVGKEGMRVSAAQKSLRQEQPNASAQRKEPTGLKPLTRDNLRNAVIWSEILRPKF